MPVRIDRRDGRDVVDWAYTQGIDFTDPFVDQTLERALRDPFRLLFRRESLLDELDADAADRARDPDGLVFHLSRCGSTLLASSLRARAGTVVLSEPGVVETVLASGPVDSEHRRARLRSLLRALAPDDQEAAYVVKLDAWSTLDLPLFLEAFPTVPWIFVGRDPGEVLVSQQRQRGFHVIPGALEPPRVGLTPDEVAGLDLDEYAAAVLGRILTCAVDGVRRAGERALVLDHRDLPQPGVDRAAAHFGLGLTDADRLMIDSLTGLNAKNPVLPYTDDRADKRSALTPEAAAAVERRAALPYRLLRDHADG